MEHVLCLALATGTQNAKVHGLWLACTLQAATHPWLLHHLRIHAAACWQLQGALQPGEALLPPDYPAAMIRSQTCKCTAQEVAGVLRIK